MKPHLSLKYMLIPTGSHLYPLPHILNVLSLVSWGKNCVISIQKRKYNLVSHNDKIFIPKDRSGRKTKEGGDLLQHYWNKHYCWPTASPVHQNHDWCLSGNGLVCICVMRQVQTGWAFENHHNSLTLQWHSFVYKLRTVKLYLFQVNWKNKKQNSKLIYHIQLEKHRFI